MRILHPCSENLPSMARVPGGVHCTRCDRDVLDLRTTPRKRALAVLAEARQTGDGRVCAWVRATKDGTPVFAPDPHPRSRWIAPVLAIGSLAACASSPPTEAAPVVAMPVVATSGGNTNGPPPAPAPVVAQPAPAPVVLHPVSNTAPVVEPTELMAGDLAF